MTSGKKDKALTLGNIRVCNTHLRGELKVEDRPDSVCGALGLVLGLKVEVVGACAHSGQYRNKRRVRVERESYKQIELKVEGTWSINYTSECGSPQWKKMDAL